MSSAKHIKGMVCVDQHTYRLERVENGFYEVIRLSDEMMVGRFAVEQTVRLEAHGVDAALLRRIAREAIQKGKTSWVYHETPPPPPPDPNEADALEEVGPITPRRLVSI
jgi:hypothetical protein